MPTLDRILLALRALPLRELGLSTSMAVSVLAATVATLGFVILLELRSSARLRRLIESRLETLSGEIGSLQAAHPAAAAEPGRDGLKPLVTAGLIEAPGLASGEVRLLASLASARARRSGRQHAPAAHPGAS